MNEWEFVATLTGQVLSWPVAMVVIVLILRNPLRALLRRLNEAEGFGLKASFQELAEVVDRIELEADLKSDRQESNVPIESDAEKVLSDLNNSDRPADSVHTMRLRSALQEARMNPKDSIRTARAQLRGRVRTWISRTVDREVRVIDYSFWDDLDHLEDEDIISSDLKLSISNADQLGRSLASRFRRPTEAEALSYLSLVNRIERLLDDEARLSWESEDEGDE